MKTADIQAKKIGKFLMNNADADYINDLLTAIDSGPEITWEDKPPLSFIFEVICNEYGFTPEEVKRAEKDGEKPFIRQAFIYLAIKIYDPLVLESIKQSGYYKGKVKAGLRRKLAEVINRSGPTVSLSLLKVYNLAQVHEDVNLKLGYFEELVYFEWVTSRQIMNDQNQT